MIAAALIQSAQDAGVTLRLVDGKVKISGTKAAVTCLLEPLRQHKADLVRWFTQTPANEPEPNAWRELARAYYSHHSACPQCVSAGHGAAYGPRCDIGALLWSCYQNTVTLSKEKT